MNTPPEILHGAGPGAGNASDGGCATGAPDLLILGSAAAEGIPAFFCDCRVCREAARRGGRETRMRTSYNIGGVLQIDFGPDAMQAFQGHRDRLMSIRHILFTHAHGDHLLPSQLCYHGEGFCGTPSPEILVHGSEPTIRRIRGDLESAAPGVGADERLRRARIATRVFRPPEIVELPDIGARIHALPADHAPDLDAAVFLVEICGRSFLIGNDTGILPDATWKALAALRGEVRIDVAVLDNTGGFLHDWRSGHMGANAVMETFDRLDGLGLLSAGCVRAVNHFSHTSGGTHAELCAFWEPRGIVVGYDGLVLPADATLGSMSRNESMQF